MARNGLGPQSDNMHSGIDRPLAASRAIAVWPALAAICLLMGCEPETPPTPLAAHEVSQPAGWADELAMPIPHDLNPDPHVLEINLEARIEELEILPGTKTPGWTYNGTVPGPMMRAQVCYRLIVHFKKSLP